MAAISTMPNGYGNESTPSASVAATPNQHAVARFLDANQSGATGDLARKKLLPALYHLHRGGLLPRDA